MGANGGRGEKWDFCIVKIKYLKTINKPSDVLKVKLSRKKCGLWARNQWALPLTQSPCWVLGAVRIQMGATGTRSDRCTRLHQLLLADTCENLGRHVLLASFYSRRNKPWEMRVLLEAYQPIYSARVHGEPAMCAPFSGHCSCKKIQDSEGLASWWPHLWGSDKWLTPWCSPVKSVFLPHCLPVFSHRSLPVHLYIHSRS